MNEVYVSVLPLFEETNYTKINGIRVLCNLACVTHGETMYDERITEAVPCCGLTM